MNKMNTRIVELIYTTERLGDGTPNNPTRLVGQLWTKEGQKVAQEGTDWEVAYCEWLSDIEFNT